MARLCAGAALWHYASVTDFQTFLEFMTGPEKIVGKRVLLVDDQAEVRDTVKLLLGLDGHTVTEARHGREALGMFIPGRFDIVITDYAMPVMKGDELAAKIKEIAPSQPILMITGSAEKFGGVQASVDALLNKPFGFDGLRCALAEVLGSPNVVQV